MGVQSFCLLAVALGVRTGVLVGVIGVAVAVTLGVADAELVSVGVGVVGQPFSALFTPVTSCETVTMPLWSSNAAQALGGWLPNAMSTPRMRSLISTLPRPLQSPTDASAIPGRSPRPTTTSTTDKTTIPRATAVLKL